MDLKSLVEELESQALQEIVGSIKNSALGSKVSEKEIQDMSLKVYKKSKGFMTNLLLYGEAEMVL